MVRLIHAALMAGVIACMATAATAEPVFSASRSATPVGQNGHAARLGASGESALGTFGGRRAFVSDGQGNAAGSQAGAFTTSAGGQGMRLGQASRTADGGFDASRQSGVTTANGGSAARSSSYARSADGSSASGERSTSVSNANTGVTYDGSTTYAKGSGVTRSGSCKDASGSTVTCGAR